MEQGGIVGGPGDERERKCERGTVRKVSVELREVSPLVDDSSAQLREDTAASFLLIYSSSGGSSPISSRHGVPHCASCCLRSSH